MVNSVAILAVFSCIFISNAVDFDYICPTNFVLTNNNYCYNFVLGETQVDFATARTSCTGAGGYLVKIDDEAENTYLKDKMGSNIFWTGLYDETNNNEFLYVDSKDTSVPYDNYAFGEPSHTIFFVIQEDCTIVNSGSWNDKQCDDKYVYVCEADPVFQCPVGFTYYINDKANLTSCYQNFETVTTFQNASDVCAESATGATLYAPTTDVEHKTVSTANTGDFWLDLTDSVNEGSFVTSTGVAAPYTSFSWFQPDNGGWSWFGWTNEDCVVSSSSGSMNDVGCDNNFAFVCKYELTDAEVAPYL